MGVVSSIDFPKQGSNLGKRVEVVFNYDLTRRLNGEIVRDDYESPHVRIIKLDDGRFLLATECQLNLGD